MQEVVVTRPSHGHHQVASAIFVASLILSAGMILSAELMKPERYEFHPGSDGSNYVIYDRNTGRATTASFDSKEPLAPLTK